MRRYRLRECRVDATVHHAERLQVAFVNLDLSVSHLGSELGEVKAEGIVERHGITAVHTISTSAAGS